jgi:glycosyltransferase involved in cell wall biosynthesis
MPVASVVIISFNGAPWIATAIKSVQSQSVADWELIVVEDGSNDGTRAIVDAFGDARIRYVWRANGGLSAARNTGILHSQAPLVAFLDCDDWWEPRKLERQLLALETNPNCGWTYSGAYKVNEAGARIVEDVPSAQPDILRTLLFYNCVSGSASSVMARRDLLVSVGLFDESVRFAEDWEMWLRLAGASEAVTVTALDVGILSRANSFGKNTDAIYSASCDFVSRATDTFASRLKVLKRPALARIAATASIDSLAAGRRNKALRYIFGSITLAPTHPQYWKRLVMTVFGIAR